MLYNPSVIVKCLSTQATYITKKYGQMFYYTDKAQLYVDTQNGGRILAKDVYVMAFERDRLNFIPDNKTTMATETDNLSNDQILLQYIYVYVVETNCLYTYQYSSKTWATIYGIYGSTTVAQTHNVEGEAVIISADDVSTNGILNNGSVVIRDENKMICGLAKSDGYTFSIQSLIGGQINLDPSSTDMGDGCFQLNSEKRIANLNNDLLVFGNIKTTNKTNWAKQYRLLTDDIKIINYTLIKAGSTIISGSLINDKTYTEDEVLTEDLETDTIGLLAMGSKIYKDSTINNEPIRPPYMFDIDEDTEYNSVPLQTIVKTPVTIEDNTLILDCNNIFNNIGDCCYINGDLTDLSMFVTKIKFKDETTYDTEYIAEKGIIKTACIIYVSEGFVKILP